jgi:hypothetical protein
MPTTDGPKSEPLRAAVRDALSGRTARLEDLFARHGGGPDPRPNLKLAAAFGDEIAAAEGPAARLLSRLGGDDAAPDTTAVFLPMAAAFGWVGRVRGGRDVEAAWSALLALAGDERAPVRAATQAALHAYALSRARGGELVTRAAAWLDDDTADREVRFGAAAVVVDVLGDRQIFATLARRDEALPYLSRVIADAADAPRSAERSDARRRVLAALPRALATVVAAGAEDGASWLERECVAARRPDVRAMLSDAVVRAQAISAVIGQRVRGALEGSAKPPRDPTRRRPGVARGKASRETR